MFAFLFPVQVKSFRRDDHLSKQSYQMSLSHWFYTKSSPQFEEAIRHQTFSKCGARLPKTLLVLGGGGGVVCMWDIFILNEI
jgi:hypothetical protein